MLLVNIQMITFENFIKTICCALTVSLRQNELCVTAAIYYKGYKKILLLFFTRKIFFPSTLSELWMTNQLCAFQLHHFPTDLSLVLILFFVTCDEFSAPYRIGFPIIIIFIILWPVVPSLKLYNI